MRDRLWGLGTWSWATSLALALVPQAAVEAALGRGCRALGKALGRFCRWLLKKHRQELAAALREPRGTCAAIGLCPA